MNSFTLSNALAIWLDLWDDGEATDRRFARGRIRESHSMRPRPLTTPLQETHSNHADA
jgi:hypothetical protein